MCLLVIFSVHMHHTLTQLEFVLCCGGCTSGLARSLKRNALTSYGRHQGRRSHRIIGGHKRRLGGSGDGIPPAGSRGGAPVGDLGPKSPRCLSFFVKLHIIFALKYNKQQLLLLLDKMNLAAKYTFKNIFFTVNFSSTKIQQIRHSLSLGIWT